MEVFNYALFFVFCIFEFIREAVSLRVMLSLCTQHFLMFWSFDCMLDSTLYVLSIFFEVLQFWFYSRCYSFYPCLWVLTILSLILHIQISSLYIRNIDYKTCFDDFKTWFFFVKLSIIKLKLSFFMIFSSWNHVLLPICGLNATDMIECSSGS